LNLAVSRKSIDVLLRIPLFSELDPNELQVLADSMLEQSFEPGEAIATEGAPADGFFVVETGEAEVTAQGQPVATMTAGDYFGEIALLMGSERTATITATTALHCYRLSPADFRVLVEGNPTIAWKVMQSMVERLA
jgi:CRP-like cAMP-binding protein